MTDDHFYASRLNALNDCVILLLHGGGINGMKWLNASMVAGCHNSSDIGINAIMGADILLSYDFIHYFTGRKYSNSIRLFLF